MEPSELITEISSAIRRAIPKALIEFQQSWDDTASYIWEVAPKPAVFLRISAEDYYNGMVIFTLDKYTILHWRPEPVEKCVMFRGELPDMDFNFLHLLIENWENIGI